MKRKLLVLAALLSVGVLTGCNGVQKNSQVVSEANSEETSVVTPSVGSETSSAAAPSVSVSQGVAVTGVTISGGVAKIYVGQTVTLTAAVAPESATNKTVTWASSDATVATVSENGVVTPVKAGSVNITATAGGVTATQAMTVEVYEAGTEAAPLSVEDFSAKALALPKSDYTQQTYSPAIGYATGIVKSVKTESSGKTTCTIVDALTTGAKEVVAYACDFKEETMVAPVPGDKVVVSGYLENFNNTAEIGKNSVICSITHAEYDVQVVCEDATVSGLGAKATSGSTQEFTVAPGAGYKVDAVTVNGIAVTAGEDGKYTFVATHTNKVEVTVAPAGQRRVVEATFTFGAANPEYTNEGASVNNGGYAADGKTMDKDTCDFTSGTCSLEFKDYVKVSVNSYDGAGNCVLKLGTGSAAASFNFTADEGIDYVVIYVAGYKANPANVKVNGEVTTVTTKSSEGDYTPIRVDLDETRKVSFETLTGGYRCKILKIEFGKIVTE